MKQELVSVSTLGTEPSLYDNFLQYQSNSKEPWASHKNGFIKFLLNSIERRINQIKDAPLAETYGLWYSFTLDLGKIYIEVSQKTRILIDKIKKKIEPYEIIMAQVQSDSLVKHHHNGGNTMKHRIMIEGYRNQKLDEFVQELYH